MQKHQHEALLPHIYSELLTYTVLAQRRQTCNDMSNPHFSLDTPFSLQHFASKTSYRGKGNISILCFISTLQQEIPFKHKEKEITLSVVKNGNKLPGEKVVSL